jgi:hypothetical protein
MRATSSATADPQTAAAITKNAQRNGAVTIMVVSDRRALKAFDIISP